MSDENWLHDLAALLASTSAMQGDPFDLRSLLFGCYQLLQRGDHAVQSAFEALADAELIAGRDQLAATLAAGSYSTTEVADLAEGVLVAANLLRALEHALFGLGQGGRTPRTAKALEVRYGDEEGWLLPFRHRFRGDPKDWPPYFAKRGLTRSRCITRALPSGLQVDLQLIDAKFGADLTAAACLFEALHLVDIEGAAIDDNTAGPFVVAGLTGRDPRAIETALAACCGPDQLADIVIFPELAITPAEQAQIASLLRDRPWDPDNAGHRPQLILAGSWHDPTEIGQHQNRAPVINREGQVVGRHAKHMVFGTPTMREAIVPGDRVLVLASESLTLAIAICLDFCQSVRFNPYDELDVDLVLVTSLANKTTVQKHSAQAARIWDRRKTATFLGQQSDAKPYGCTGASPHPNASFPDYVQRPVATRKFTFTS